MLSHRVIPLLLMDRQRLVKTRNFKRPVYVGDPLNVLRIFNEKEVDEIIIVDIGASRDQKEPDFDYIEELAGECFVPLTYGGGVNSISHAQRLFRLGVEKVALNSSALERPNLIRELSDTYGSQSIVASVDLRRSRSGVLEIFSAATRQVTKGEPSKVLADLQELGVGEILIQSVDREGDLSGPDLDIIAQTRGLNVPVIYAGGVASIADVRMAIAAGADSVAAGAWFVFHGPHRAVLIWYPPYQELDTALDGVR